jgi:hypothetical protein
MNIMEREIVRKREVERKYPFDYPEGEPTLKGTIDRLAEVNKFRSPEGRLEVLRLVNNAKYTENYEHFRNIYLNHVDYKERNPLYREHLRKTEITEPTKEELENSTNPEHDLRRFYNAVLAAKAAEDARHAGGAIKVKTTPEKDLLNAISAACKKKA